MEYVKKDHRITIAYTLCDKFGNLIEEVTPDNPLVYLHGHENIIPGLEAKLQGKKIGDAMKVVIPPEEAFGVYQNDLIMQVDPEELADLGKLTPGMEIELYKEEVEGEEEDEEEDIPFKEPTSPDDLYGEEDEEFIEEEDEEEPLVFIVKEVTTEYILLDGNHRLAGKELVFNVTILDIQMASFEEIERGYLDYYNSEDEEDNNRLF